MKLYRYFGGSWKPLLVDRADSDAAFVNLMLEDDRSGLGFNQLINWLVVYAAAETPASVVGLVLHTVCPAFSSLLHGQTTPPNLLCS